MERPFIPGVFFEKPLNCRACEKAIGYKLAIALRFFLITIASVLLHLEGKAQDTVHFCHRIWDITNSVSNTQGPSNNFWSADKTKNVWVDKNGWLHLKITRDAANPNKWYCSQVKSRDKLGSGTYQFQVEGAIDQLNENVVFGMFSYPDGNLDGYDEIDIEYSRWGKWYNIYNFDYVVYGDEGYPKDKDGQFYHTSLSGTYTTQRYQRKYDQVTFQSIGGFHDDNTNVYKTDVLPKKTLAAPKRDLSVLLNLWLYNGGNETAAPVPPSDGKEVEIIVHSFTFTPDGCNENYEPNYNPANAAALFPAPLSSVSATNTINSIISSGADQDWYSIPVGGKGNLNISLSDLPADYDMELYPINGLSGGALKWSYNTGTTPESISYTYDNSTQSVLYVKVYPKNSSQYNACGKYALSVQWKPASTGGCQTPVAPTAVFGSDNCSSGTSINGTTALLSFNSSGGSSYRAQVSKYPYGASNIISPQNCQTSTDPIPISNLILGMLYRWNMYALGSTDCTSCQSPVSNTKYFSLPPVITAPGNQVPATLSTQAQNPGSGTTVIYKWYRNGSLVQQSSSNTLTAAQTGTYTLVIDYSGSPDCAGATSTGQSNSIVLSDNGNCTPSTAPISILPTVSGNQTLLQVNGGSLGTNAEWKWYSGNCGETSVGSGTAITVNPTSTTSYDVRAESNCSAPTACASLTINGSGGCQPSVAPLAISQLLSADRKQLQLTVVGGSLGTNAIWHWYTGDCFGTPLTTSNGNSIIVDASVVTTYFVKAEGGDCGGTTTCAYTIVNIPPCIPSTDPSFISLSDTTTDLGQQLKLTVKGGSLGTDAKWAWYSGRDCTGTVVNAGTNNFLLLAPFSIGTYSVHAEGGECGATNCISIELPVCTPSARPDSIGIRPASNGYVIQIYGGSLGTDASWVLRSGACNGPVIGNSSGDNIQVYPTETTTYFLTAEGGCSTQDCVYATATIMPPPTITDVNPLTAEAGTPVIVTGANFTAGSRITFGGVEAASVTLNSSTSITAIVGLGATGNVEVINDKDSFLYGGFIFQYSLPTDNFRLSATSTTCRGTADGAIGIEAVQNQVYDISINGIDHAYSYSNTFNDKLNVSNLVANTYQVCITIPSQPTYRSCYILMVTEPPDLSLYSAVDSRNNSITLQLKGGSIYHVQLNGKLYTTTESSLTLALAAGDNNLVVTTDKECQGIIHKLINVSDKVLPYPDPFQNVLNVNLGNKTVNAVKIKITNLSSNRVFFTGQYNNQAGIIQLDVSQLVTGAYALTLTLDNKDTVYKVLKQ